MSIAPKQQLDLNLIDLISDRHYSLRRITEHQWNLAGNIPISNSEWFIIARIYKGTPTISYITKHVDITRQAVHKLIRKLESKGLIEIHNMENNKKVKCLQLTPFGQRCYELNEAYKAKIEEDIARVIGQQQLEHLKHILKMDWML